MKLMKKIGLSTAFIAVLTMISKTNGLCILTNVVYLW